MAIRSSYLEPDSWFLYFTSGETFTFVLVRLDLESFALRGAVLAEAFRNHREKSFFKTRLIYIYIYIY